MDNVSEKCVIYTQKGEIQFNDSVVALRHKTFELLLLLARKPDEIFSKAQILESVWADTVVEDQVIFQSINEIRKEFGCSGVIKTYPRRGYSWNCSDTSIYHDSDSSSTTKEYKESTPKPFMYSIAIVLVVAVLTSLIYLANRVLTSEAISSDNYSTSMKVHKGVLILPFKVSSLHDSEKWIRFGAMQGVIDSISPNDGITVFQLEDTIEIMNRLPSHEKNNISNIFNKSGASVILETSISGVSGDYDIVYSVYTQSTVETNTLNVKDINDGINQLSMLFDNLVAHKNSIEPEFINSKLHNELIAKAVQYLEKGDYQSAYAFLESATIHDKANVYAHYLSAKVAIISNKFDETLESSKTALKLINNGANQRYKNRLLFMYGAALLAKGNISNAKQLLQQAELASKANKDWLYLSYTQSMLGKVYQKNQDFSKAKLYFNSALQYQELLHCPMGVAQGHLDLAEFYLAQDQREKCREELFNS